MGDVRYERAWDAWAAVKDEPERRKRFLAASDDDLLVEILASRSAEAAASDRNVVATELLNRVRRRSLESLALVEKIRRYASGVLASSALRLDETQTHALETQRLLERPSEDR